MSPRYFSLPSPGSASFLGIMQFGRSLDTAFELVLGNLRFLKRLCSYQKNVFFLA